MVLQFSCPYCDAVSSVPDSFAGKQGKCPSCAKVIEVPDPAKEDLEGPAAAPEGEPVGAHAGEPVGTPVEGTVESPGETRQCQFCGETIKRAAKKCRFCGEFLDATLRHERRHGMRGGRAPLASPWIRLGAVMLDGVLLMPPYFVLIAGVVMTDGFNKSNPAGVALFILGVVLMLGLVFYQWYLTAQRGASLAKGWLGLKIVKDDGGDVGFVDGVILRIWVLGFVVNVLGSVIPGVGCVGLLDALMIFSESRKCLHDHIASTIVIQVPKGPAR